jgi:hypothetical protein
LNRRIAYANIFPLVDRDRLVDEPTLETLLGERQNTAVCERTFSEVGTGTLSGRCLVQNDTERLRLEGREYRSFTGRFQRWFGSLGTLPGPTHAVPRSGNSGNRCSKFLSVGKYIFF